MTEEKGYGLLISAIVSIVAIVGMVVLFSSGGSSGQVVSRSGGYGGHPTFGTSDRVAGNERFFFVEPGFVDDFGIVCEGIASRDGTTGVTTCGQLGDNWGRMLSTKSERLARSASQGYFDEYSGVTGSGEMRTTASIEYGSPAGDLAEHGVPSESQTQYGRPMTME
ncbi:hypothetical protein HY641_00265 [Candidatus Woesearchaeota archaeon]|nr:hypothetical protein [Candidatus Woesearchaeota archaeon]